MKIFVTGGAGFIGGNFIIKELDDSDMTILNYDKLTYAGNINTLNSIEGKINYIYTQGDICDKSSLNKVINDFMPDYIVHFAAESHVDRSIDSPLEFINTNIVGTALLLDEALKYYNSLSNYKRKIFKFLHISTDEVYGSLEEDGYFKETTPYDPSSPYSASKASSDHLVRAWNRTYGLPTLITNCSNNYGPYQFPEKLIPLMIINCLHEKELPVYGQGLNVRDWLFVTDHCEAIHRVLMDGYIGETYNIGGNTEIKNIEIVRIICNILDKKHPRSNGNSYEELISYVEDRPGHDFRYAIDSSKIKNELNWEPKETFESGINKTIIWYLTNKEWWQSIINNTYQQQRLGSLNK